MSRPFRLVLTLLSIVGLTLATAPPSGADPVSAGRSAASAPDSDATSNGPTPAEQAENSGKPVATQDEPKNGVWIIRLKDPAVATYTGGLAGLSRTAPAEPGGKLDTNSRAAKAYASHLTRRQNAVKATIDNTVGHSVTAEHRYRYALNGLALKLSADEAAAVAELPGVEAVEADRSWQPDTDVSTQIIAAPAIWGGGTATGLATKGEGVLVGTLDTGINAAHPSFAATDEDGYTHLNPFGEGNYKGVCAEGAANYEDICNSKLVGAYDFAGERTALDKVGHGSHTASTMAGDRHTAHITVGNTTYDRALTGVAPHASLISYKVCTSFGCYSSASVAAVDQAIADGVDVLNYSISGSDRPWNDSVDLAFLAAYNAGIFIAASAGNTGPGESTVAKTGPWNASVAASTNTRVIAMDASVTGPGTAPTELTGMAAVSGSGPGYSEPIEAALIDVGSIADGDQIGCSAFPAGALEGAIALIKRGDCNFSVKVNNAANAGAVGVIVHNQFPGPPIVMGELESTSIPSLMISQADGQAVLAFVSANQGTTLRMGTEAVQVDNPAWKDLVADFSSRGPSQYDLLAPTFTAPGRNILAATAAVGDDPVQYEVMQGTSMSSPHAAGSGALIRALHPDWSPSAIRSALASTANPDGMVKEDGSTPADAFDIGSGLLDLDAASRVGVILDETYDNFVAADPNTGGDPKTLNLPAIVDDACLQTCTLTRTLTSVADTTADYTIEVDAPGDATVTVTPQTFTLAPGATQELTVTIDVAALTGPGWLFGDLKLSTDGTHAGGAEIADVHYPIAVVPAEAEIALDQESITDTIAVPEARDYPLQVLNNGGAPLHWAVDAASADCALPAWLSLDPTSGTVPAEDSATATLTVATQNLTAGEHSARLCLSSNDPHTELATLAVTINVQEIPDVAVDPEQLTLSAPAGGTDTANVTIANTGYGTLNWRLDDPEAGASPERLELLRNGVLLVPNSTTSSRGIMAFDAQDGTLIDDQFLPYPAWSPGGSTLYTPLNVLPMPDGQSFLVSDQVKGMITRWDLEGNFLGTFGPKTVEGDSSVMNNVRGMAWTAQDTLVTVASGANANSILELSQDGELLGYFVDPGEDGLDSPWSILVRDNDVLVSASGTKQIHRFSLTGEPLPAFGEVTWAEQLAETASGNVLAANWQTTPARGVLEFSATGDYLGNLYPDNTGNNYGGVAELGNGNLLITSSKGVVEIGRDGTAVAEQTTGRGRYITPVTLPDARPCQLPTDVPWLSVSAPSGATTRGQDASVQVTADATGLAAGDHSALLCVSSDDPDRPTVTLPVTLTVGAASTTTLTADVASQTYLPAKPATLTANVDAPIDTTVSGTVEFRRGAEVIGTAPVTNRTAKLEVPVDTPAGTHALTATFVAEDPSALLGSTSAALFFKVNMALSATTVGAKKVRLDAATARASGRSWGLQVTAKVTIAAPSTAPADGVAHINIGGSKVASVPVSGGTGVSAVIPVPAGLNPVIVTYLPDDPSVQRSTGRVSATVGR